jgi:hypothetical protein
MNLEVSPDLDALVCYAIVFGVGALGSLYQLWISLGGLLGVWAIIEAWAVFFVYSIVPVALFWILDRTGAIHDTSVFAALLVGFGYQQILSGQSSVKGPAEAAGILQFLSVWTDRMLPRIRDRMARNGARFKATVVAAVVDAAKFADLKQLAILTSADPATLNQQLENIAAQQPLLGDQGVLEKQAKALYDVVSILDDFRYLLWRRKIISRFNYWWYAHEFRSKIIAGGVLLASVAIFVFGVWLVHKPQIETPYYVWRLEKANTTRQDRFRTRLALLAILKSCNDYTYPRIAKTLKRDSLPPEIVGRATEILIESQPSAAACHVDLAKLMAEGLRNSDPDSRARVQSALVYVAGLQKIPEPDGFSAWHPSTQDSAPSLDIWIRKWESKLKPER